MRWLCIPLLRKPFHKKPCNPIGSGYCLEKLGRYGESVKKHRRADALEPDNYEILNDLGYALLEAGEFDEAEEVFQRSIALAPPGYEFPRNNLNLLKEKKKG